MGRMDRHNDLKALRRCRLAFMADGATVVGGWTAAYAEIVDG
jgi:hypothetical protein